MTLQEYIESLRKQLTIDGRLDLLDRIYLEKVEEKVNALELLTKCGITLVVPESECLNNERLTIQLYKKHTTKEQWEKLLELFDIK